jgi:hypothetical protein
LNTVVSISPSGQIEGSGALAAGFAAMGEGGVT